MPRFAANLSFLFPELPLIERIDAAASCGFRAIEILNPYEVPAQAIAARLKAHDLTQVLINTPPGDPARGERGLTALPGREAAYREALSRALDYCGALGCGLLHSTGGIMPPGTDRARFEATYRANLAHAAAEAAKQGVTITIEPLNDIDTPNVFLSRLAHARAVLRDVARPNLRLQFDAYHTQLMEGEVIGHYRDCLPLIAHLQVSSVPGRHEPDTTAPIDFPAFFRAVDDSGYAGWVSCEYRPRGDTRAGLAWAKPWGIG